tara:strand:- start:390 stop:863 length:474 start_codon:yes stop_codon:yes gene_type:complete
MKPTLEDLESRQAREVLGILEMSNKQILRVETSKDFTKDYMIGSVASYYIEYNQDPIRGIEEAKKNGHALYWLNPMASYISSNPRPLDKVKHWVQSDQIVGRNSKAPEDCIQIWFQGKLFNVEHTANDNLHMTEVKSLTDAQVKKLEDHQKRYADIA